MDPIDLQEARGGARRILVLASDRLIAEALATVLAGRGFATRCIVTSSARHCDEALAWDPDVALVDVKVIDDESRLLVIGRLRRAAVPIAVMSGTVDAHVLAEWVDAGISAVIDLSSPVSELVRTLCRILTDKKSVEATTRQYLMTIREREADLRRARLGPFRVLTPRERHVLGEIVKGQSAEQIATDSWVSISTVRSQIKSILQKLGVNSQVAAVALARQAGWTGEADEPVGPAHPAAGRPVRPRGRAGSAGRPLGHVKEPHAKTRAG